MKKPCILCVAITGSLPTKADNPAVPISLQEQIESTQSAFEAGATSLIVMFAIRIRHHHLTLKNLLHCWRA